MRSLVTGCAMLALLLSGCSPASTPDASTTESSTAKKDLPTPAQGAVELGPIRLTAPPQWKRIEPSSSFVAAEFVIPRDDGDNEDGRLTVSTAGGTVEANIDRWKAQFDPAPEKSSQEEVDAAGMKITIVDLSGDFNDQRGPFAPAVKRPNYRMIAAVVPSEGQLYFIKATGPKQTIANLSSAIHEFIRSVRATN